MPKDYILWSGKKKGEFEKSMLKVAILTTIPQKKKKNVGTRKKKKTFLTI